MGNIKKPSLYTLLWDVSAYVETFTGSIALAPGCASETLVTQVPHIRGSNSAGLLKPQLGDSEQRVKLHSRRISFKELL